MIKYMYSVRKEQGSQKLGTCNIWIGMAWHISDEMRSYLINHVDKVVTHIGRRGEGIIESLPHTIYYT